MGAGGGIDILGWFFFSLLSWYYLFQGLSPPATNIPGSPSASGCELTAVPQYPSEALTHPSEQMRVLVSRTSAL